jgi:hypothetical protein
MGVALAPVEGSGVAPELVVKVALSLSYQHEFEGFRIYVLEQPCRRESLGERALAGWMW